MQDLLFQSFYEGYSVNWKKGYRTLRVDVLNEILTIMKYPAENRDKVLICFVFSHGQGEETKRKEARKFIKKFINNEKTNRRNANYLLVEENHNSYDNNHYHGILFLNRKYYSTKKKVINFAQKIWKLINPYSKLYMKENEHFFSIKKQSEFRNAFYAASYSTKENDKNKERKLFWSSLKMQMIEILHSRKNEKTRQIMLS